MSEQTLSEALSEIDMDLNISEEDIEQAAVPKKYTHSQTCLLYTSPSPRD